MANYLEMNREELTAEKAKLNEQYKKFLAMNLKLNMARGKPGPHQMDLAMGLLQMTDYTTDAGTDARNYGDLEGLHEAPAEETPEEPVPQAQTYTVEAGDCLWNIAYEVYGTGTRWTVIYEANRDTIRDPGMIHIGQVLTIPAA